MAEALLRARLQGLDCEVSSAGTHALVGNQAAQFTREVLLDYGYDVGGHRARQATRHLLTDATLILAIDQDHANWTVSNYPQLRGRVHKLGKWRHDMDVADPYGKAKEAFVVTYELVERLVDDWVPHLKKLLPAQASQKFHQNRAPV